MLDKRLDDREIDKEIEGKRKEFVQESKHLSRRVAEKKS